MASPLALFDYQAHAADIAAQRDRYGIHDEMGIGKTATSIGVMNRILATRVIVVCPGMLRTNWVRELKRFGRYPLRVCIGKTIHDYVAWKRDRFDVLVTSYELATKWTPDLREQGEFLDLIVFDEAHYLKNLSAQRTIQLLGEHAGGENSLVQWAVQALHVTGTPMANDPMDVYTFLRFSRAIQMEPNEFRHTFFHVRPTTYGSRQTVREDMLPALRSLVRNNSIARTHRDVGLQLPKAFITETLIDGNMIEVDNLIREYPSVEAIILHAIETGDVGALDAPYIATLRRLLGKAKAEPYARLLLGELQGGLQKHVVFCIHDEPMLYIAKFLQKHKIRVATLAGFTAEADRQAAVDAFTNDPNVRVLIAKIRVAGVGLNLTQGNTIDLLESDWTPAGNAQALKRVHRHGQTRNVYGRFITLADSFDVNVNETVARKTREIALVEDRADEAALQLHG